MSMSRALIIVALVLGCGGVASAQSVRLQFSNGRVSLSAQNAPIRTILAEWARIGGTHIVNGERVAGPPLTLELTNVPERQALDIILRSVSGYMAGPRLVTAAGTSSFDRIMILPTSTTAAAPAPPVRGTPPVFGSQPSFPSQFDPDDPEENPPNDLPPNPGDGPNQRGRPFQRGRVPPPGVVQAQPFPPLTQPDPDDLPEETPAPATNPFGVVPGSARPGVVTPVPQSPRPNQRPNGDPEP
jgi:hypothetical protein